MSDDKITEIVNNISDNNYLSDIESKLDTDLDNMYDTGLVKRIVDEASKNPIIGDVRNVLDAQINELIEVPELGRYLNSIDTLYYPIEISPIDRTEFMADELHRFKLGYLKLRHNAHQYGISELVDKMGEVMRNIDLSDIAQSEVTESMEYMTRLEEVYVAVDIPGYLNIYKDITESLESMI